MSTVAEQTYTPEDLLAMPDRQAMSWSTATLWSDI